MMPRTRKRARRPLTVEGKLSLAHAAWRWASAATLLRRPRSTVRDQWDFSQLVIIHTVDSVDWERYTRGLHMLCLCIEHLDRCLHLLAGSPLRAEFPHQLCRDFRTAWRPLKDLRDVLEHEEDYIAGIGRKVATLVDPDVHGWINIRGVQVPMRPHQETRNAEGLLVGYRVMGRHYDLTRVLQLAENLARSLSDFVWPAGAKSTDGREREDRAAD
jgi:hypothetical protein